MSQNYFEKVRDFLVGLDIDIGKEDPLNTLFIVNDEDDGISNLHIACQDEILVLEQIILKISGDNPALFKRLLQMNRELVHGAFVLDEDGSMVLFRDTLQLENLDRNEIEASINALSLGLASFADELIDFGKTA